MKSDLPPIVRLAERVTVAIEEAVRGFPRFSKYTHGAVLRTRAMDVWETAVQSWRKRDQQLALVEQLSERIDNLKLAMRLCARLKAFRSTREFAAIYILVRDLGKQCGGWKKQLVKRLNAAPEQHGAPQSPQILSAPVASLREANP